MEVDIRRGEVIASAVALTTATGTGVLPASAQPKQPLRLNIFPGLNAWPIYVMAERDVMSIAGYSLVIKATNGSVAQAQAILNGEADMALTALDNVIAYDIGQGDEAVAGEIDFAAFLAIGFPALTLQVRPEITAYDQLRGKTFAVDAPGTGFSFILRRILQHYGLQPSDYTLLAVGATQKRFDAMMAGECVGGMVAAPFDLIGTQQYGFRSLSTAIEALGHYEANVMMARRSWIDAHQSAVTAFVGGYRTAMNWLYDNRNRSEAIDVLVRYAGLPGQVVTQVAPGILNSPASYSRDGRFDAAGVKTVIDLRASYGTPPKAVPDAPAFIDARFTGPST